MKTLIAFYALVIGLAACGSKGHPMIIDSGGDDGGALCNPAKQTGCADNEKCAWIQDQLVPTPVGHIGCVPDGTVAEGAAGCGAATGLGADLCVKGSTCIGSCIPGSANNPCMGADTAATTGLCERVCDVQVSAATSGCDAAMTACSRYSSLFTIGGTITFGACDIRCNPLTNVAVTGANANHCNDATSVNTNRTCVISGGGAMNDGIDAFTCARTPIPARDRKDGADAYGPSETGPNPMPGPDSFSNGCAFGYIPLFFLKDDGTMTVGCTGTCAPLESDSVAKVGVIGDVAAVGALTGAEPAAGNAVCTATKKGSAPTAGTVTYASGGSGPGQECRFFWSVNHNQTNFLAGRFNDTLGVCNPFSKFKYDNDKNAATPDVMLPACGELPKTGTANATHKLLSVNLPGCTKEGAFVPPPAAKTIPEYMFRVRAAFGPIPNVRHTFE